MISWGGLSLRHFWYHSRPVAATPTWQTGFNRKPRRYIFIHCSCDQTIISQHYQLFLVWMLQKWFTSSSDDHNQTAGKATRENMASCKQTSPKQKERKRKRKNKTKKKQTCLLFRSDEWKTDNGDGRRECERERERPLLKGKKSLSLHSWCGSVRLWVPYQCTADG